MKRRGFLALIAALVVAPVAKLFGSETMFRRTPIRWVPKLADDTTNPVYGVNLNSPARWVNYVQAYTSPPPRVELMALIKKQTGKLVYIPPFDKVAYHREYFKYDLIKHGFVPCPECSVFASRNGKMCSVCERFWWPPISGGVEPYGIDYWLTKSPV